MPTIAYVAPILPVRDLARAMDFYRHLGFSAEAWQGGGSYGFIQRDGHELHLSCSDKLTGCENPSAAYFYLAKGAAESLQTEFRTAGVEILSPLAPRPWNMKDFTIADPDGNHLHFGEKLS